jgi:UPF0176 protein
MRNLLFYQYRDINPETLQHQFSDAVTDLDVQGRFLLAEEGINGAVSIADDDAATFKHLIREHFPDISFKTTPCDNHTFPRFHITIKDELVKTGRDIDLDDKAPYLEPEQLPALLNRDDVVLLDARNAYEAHIGAFDNAITPNVETFEDWFDAVTDLDIQDKTIITYCTGGIRCEKASAYLTNHGYDDVYQLHGGILTYAETVGTDHWHGELFMFDDRLNINLGSSPITHCTHCDTATANIDNCANTTCDQLHIACTNCRDTYNDRCGDCT